MKINPIGSTEYQIQTIINTINGRLDTTNFFFQGADLSIIGRNTVWEVFDSTLTGFSGTPTQNIKFMKFGSALLVEFSISGTSNATGLTFTLPFSIKDSIEKLVLITDNGTAAVGCFKISSKTATVYATVGEGSWTASGTKKVSGSFVCEIGE